MPPNESDPLPRRDLGRRVRWFLGSAASGGLAGWVGSSLSADPTWWVAVPAALAIGWLFVADPSTCEPCATRIDEGPADRTEPQADANTGPPTGP